jgi:hypothetical protein
MVKLIEILKELFASKHYVQRKNERGNIIKIILPKEAYAEYDIAETNNKLKLVIEDELSLRLERLEGSDMDASNTFNIGYKILKPILVSNGVEYPIKMVALSTKRDTVVETTGQFYFGVIRDNTFITIILSNVKNDSDLVSQIEQHIVRKDINRESKILTPSNFEYRINIHNLYGETSETPKETPKEESVDYTVRTDYRKGAAFTHKQHGEGTIVNTSAGVGGKGDTNGKLDWVDVDFKKMYVFKGVPTTIRRISPVYTKVYFDTQKKKQ